MVAAAGRRGTKEGQGFQGHSCAHGPGNVPEACLRRVLQAVCHRRGCVERADGSGSSVIQQLSSLQAAGHAPGKLGCVLFAVHLHTSTPASSALRHSIHNQT